MDAVAVTNCVRVWVLATGTTGSAMARAAEIATVCHVRRELENFGGLARMDLCRGADDEPILEAAFFDVRCAEAARCYFGEWCEFGQSEGERWVIVPKAELPGVDLEEVSNSEETQDGEYKLEFFDTLAAARVREAAARSANTHGDLSTVSDLGTMPSDEEEEDSTASVHSSTLSECGEAAASAPAAPKTPICLAAFLEFGDDKPPAVETQEVDALEPKSIAVEPRATPASASARRPLMLSGLNMSSLRWDDLDAKREWRTALHLRGLPRMLCGAGSLEKLLESSGLSELVASVRVAQPQSSSSRSLGHAVLVAKAVDGVPKLAKYFHGRQFGNSMPIAVCFAADQSQALKPKKIRPASSSLRSPPSPLSRASTKASASPIGSEPSFLDFPPGLMPPPGLELEVCARTTASLFSAPSPSCN